MARNRGPARALCTLGSALLILSGCDRLSHGDADWARAALERNPDLTVVASDKDANTFTVQVKGGKELRIVRADEVIGTLPSTGVAPTVAEQSESAKVSPSTESPPPAQTPEAAARTAQTPEPAPHATEPAPQTAGQPVRPAGEPAQPAAEAAPPVGEPARPADETDTRSASAPTVTGLKSGTGFVTDSAGNTRTFGGANPQAAGTGAAASSAAGSEEQAASGKEARAPKKVLAAGPGYTVTAGEPQPNQPIHLAEATELKSPSNASLERRVDPMICQGQRLLQIDGRNIEFEGDGLSALDGCELHVTNSHIIAHGLGLSVRAANVHVQNSIIEGDGGSVSASQGAKVYSQHSTFKGLSRRLDTATIEDLGGTHWN